MKYVRLQHVCFPGERGFKTKGSNKFYEMEQVDGTSFVARWGRYGGHTSSKTYPMTKWTTLLRTKLKKGYRDITPKKVSKAINLNYDYDAAVLDLLDRLLKWSGESLQTYDVSTADVTPQMIKQAQVLLDSMQIGATDNTLTVSAMNDILRELYTLFPRTMPNTGDYMFKTAADFERILTAEQESLDNLATQAKIQSELATNEQAETDLLGALGIEICPVSPDLGFSYRRAWAIANKPVTARFEAFLEGRNPDYTGYHATRKHCLWPIIQQGFLVRPPQQRFSRPNYGFGIYTGPYEKAAHYGDWLFQVVLYMGKRYVARRTDPSLSLSKLVDMGFESTMSENGLEYVVYRPEQCNVKMLIET